VRSFSGVGGANVEFIAEGSLAAVVSQLGTEKVRPQRANLAAHHRILHDLAEQRPVLPVAFGTITGDEEQLRRVLRRNREALAGLLERLRGKVEMGLKVYWDLPNVFEYFVAIKIKLCDIELLSIQIRLVIASVDKAREMGLTWWWQTPQQQQLPQYVPGPHTVPADLPFETPWGHYEQFRQRAEQAAHIISEQPRQTKGYGDGQSAKRPNKTPTAR
jgi:hypothetical protein